MASFGRALLASWFAVVATGTDLRHSHAAAEGRTHGYSWPAALGLTGPPAGDPQPGTAPGGAHRHLILLGIESGALAHDSGAPDPRSDQHGETSLTQLSPPCSQCGTGSPLGTGPDGAAAGGWPAPPPVCPATSAPRGVGRPPAVHFCPSASLARSGVLRS